MTNIHKINEFIENNNIKNELIAKATEINGTYFVGENVAVHNADALRKIAILFKIRTLYSSK